MTRIGIIYNPYKETSRILADGLPISEHGELARYQTEPFYRWSGEILDVIARQLNDVYTLVFTAPMVEREIIEELGKGHPDCRKAEGRPCAVNLPAAKRFDALMGALGRRADFTVYLATPPGKEALRGEAKTFSSSGAGNARTMRSPCAQGDIRLLPGLPPPGADPAVTLCVWLSDGFGEERQIPAGIFLPGAPAVLSIALSGGQTTGFDHLSGNLYAYRCEPGKLEKLLFRFLEYACITPMFKMLATTELLSGVPANLLGIDCVEPVVRVSGPASLEEGRSGKFKISVYPPNNPPPHITYRTLPDGVAACQNDTICGLAAGDVTVEAYVSGSPEPCSRFNVQVYRRNRIKSLSLPVATQTIEIPEGALMELPCTWEPADADNINTIVWSCSSGVCQVSGRRGGVGAVKAVKAGDAEIIVSAEGVSARLQVRVRRTIREIRLSADSIDLRIGQDAPLSYRYAPSDAYQPEVVVKITDPSVAVYQNGKILPRRVGETDIVFHNAAGGASAVCKVRVGTSSGERQSGGGAAFFSILLLAASFLAPGYAALVLAAASLLTLFLGVYRQSKRFTPFIIAILLGCGFSIAKWLAELFGIF